MGRLLRHLGRRKGGDEFKECATSNRYRAVTVDPTKVHDIGPNTGTPGEAEWLYSDVVLSGYGRAQIRGGSKE